MKIKLIKTGRLETPDTDTIGSTRLGCSNNCGGGLERQSSGLLWCHICGTLYKQDNVPLNDKPPRSITLTIRGPILERVIKFSRSMLRKQHKSQLVYLMPDLGLTVPKHIEDYTKANLIEDIWQRILCRSGN